MLECFYPKVYLDSTYEINFEQYYKDGYRAIIFDIDSLYSVAVILSAMFGLFGTIFGIIKYVARFAFPEEDEKYITEIVKSIQENDLKDKQENIKVSFMKK